MIRRMKEEQIW